MGIKIKSKLTFKKDLSDAKTRFYQVINKVLPAQILDFISKGISPVGNQRKYQKYSDSYKAQIQNKLAFMTLKNGKVIPITADGKKRKSKASAMSKITEMNKIIIENNKKRSPVNMKLTGDMVNSFKHEIVKKGVRFWFTDEKAEYHDIQGAGKKGVIRRLLPNTGNRVGENFNRRLVDRIRSVFEKQIKRINLKR